MCKYSPDLVISLQSSYISNSKRDWTDFFPFKFHSRLHDFQHRLWQGLVCSAGGPFNLGQLGDGQLRCSVLLVFGLENEGEIKGAR